MTADPSDPPPELLERGEELRLLAEAVDRTPEGRVLVLRGEPGAGKTALLDVAARDATARGIRILRARGRRLESTFAWGGLGQLLPGVLRDLEDAGRFLPAVDPALDDEDRHPHPPHRAGPFGDVPSGASSRRLEIADRAFVRLRSLAADDPVLLLLDDAQWLDLATLQLACYLSHRIEGAGLSLVAATHTRLDEPRDRLLDDLAHAPTGRLRELRPLSPGATRSLLRTATDPVTADAYAGACHVAAGGNPRLTVELVEELGRTREAPGVSGPALVARLRPPSVTRSVAGRLGALDPRVRDVVEALAVLGSGTETYILAAVVDATTETTTVLVDLAARDHLLSHRRPPEFVHPLLEAAVLDQLSVGRRSVLHARAHEAIAAAGGDVVVVAAHLLRVEPSGRPDVVGLLRRAARRAADAGDPSTAESFLRRAGRERATDDAGVEEDLGRLLLGGPRHRFAVRRLERARELHPDPEQRCRIDLLLAGAHFQRGAGPRAVVALRRGLAEPLDADHELHHELSAALTAIDGSASDGAPHDPVVDDDPERRGARGGPPAAGATAIERLAFGRAAIADLRGGTVAHDVVADRARTAWPPALDPSAHALDAITLPIAALALACSDDLSAAGSRLDREVRRATAAGDRMSLATASFLRGITRYAGGALADAIDDLDVALDAATVGWVFALPACRAIRAVAAFDRDETELVPALLALPGGDGPWLGHPSFPYVLVARGLLADARGRTEEALDLAVAAGKHQRRRGVHNPALLPWQADVAMLAHRLGREAEAHAAADELCGRCEAFGAPRAIGVGRRTAALVGLGDPAVLLAEAADAFDRAGAAHEVARTLVALGAWHRAAGRPGDAVEPLGRAVDLARRAGATAIARRAAAELRAAGGPSPGRRGEAPGTLTPGERRVAGLAASGRSNRQIADELVVTLRTVESHLTRVYAKLGTTRAGLPAMLGGEGRGAEGRAGRGTAGGTGRDAESGAARGAAGGAERSAAGGADRSAPRGVGGRSADGDWGSTGGG